MIKHLALAAALLASGCKMTGGGVRPAAPKGFAAEVDPDDGDQGVVYRALSPDGVAFRVRVVDQEPKAKLTFWRDSVKQQLLEQGYKLKSSTSVKASGKTGYQLDFLAPLQDADFRFVVAMFERGDEIVLVEAAGDQKTFQKVQKQVKDAIASLKLN